MNDKLLDSLKEHFSLKEMEVGEYQKLKAKGMTFSIHQYYAKGLGNVSVMSAKGFFGMMKMNTFIVNPVEKDLPLFSYDRIHAVENDTLILELYDTMLEARELEKVQEIKDRFADLPKHNLGEHWYDSIKLQESDAKKGRRELTGSFDAYTMDYFQSYINGAKDLSACDSAAKTQKASVYVEGLLSQGGPSTDVFKKAFGIEKTEKLFREILFGIA